MSDITLKARKIILDTFYLNFDLLNMMDVKLNLELRVLELILQSRDGATYGQSR